MKRVCSLALVALFAASLGAQQPTPEVEEFLEVVKEQAAQGDAEAQYDLGVTYATGEGVPQDYSEALKLFRLAAEQRFARAQYNLGVMYDEGAGVPQDYLQAHKWTNLAASRASGKDVEKYGKARDTLADIMTPGQLAEAQRLAREWKPKTWEELKGE